MGPGAVAGRWSPRRWRRAMELFDQAAALPAAQRSQVLARAAGEDDELRRRVVSMLAADDAQFLDRPLFSFSETAEPGDGSQARSSGRLPSQGQASYQGEARDVPSEGRSIGPYRILQPLGRGGMGEVYLARQLQPVERPVALKLLRRHPGRDSLRRFRSESALLARVEHPNVARLYDAGTDSDGTPYLVMELVDGLPLDQHCDRGKLSLEQRVSLFRQVCMGVQAAHARLLVHRDVKPANILVASDGTPKLVDFGVAKLLDPDGPGAPRTRTGLRLLTPRYASPEQILGQELDTRSDVYSLGVVLYELLTGASPYPGSPEGRHLEDAICRDPPERPSEAAARLSREEAVTSGRGSQGSQVAHRLRGDLDTILLKALRKDPSRRYGSAEALAEDLRRWRDRLPIRARPESWSYRGRKLLSRHRLAAVASSVLLALLAAFGVVHVRELEEHARQIDRERVQAEQVSELLIEMLTTVEGTRPEGSAVTAAELLAAGARWVGAGGEREPAMEVSLLQTIGRVFHGLNRDQEAEEVLRRSLGLLEGTAGTRSGDLADALQYLGNVERELGKLAEADDHLRRARAIRWDLRRRRPDRLADVLRDLAMLSWERLDLAAAESYFRQALRWSTGPSAKGRDQWLDNLQAVAELTAAADLLEESARLRQQQLESRRRLLGHGHPEVAVTLLELGDLEARRSDRHRAEARYREAHDLLLKGVGPRHPLAKNARRRLAATLGWLGRYGEAETLYRRILAEGGDGIAGDEPEFLFALHNLGVVLSNQGKYGEGETALRRVLAGLGSRYPEEPCKAAPAHFSLGRSFHLQGRLAEAEERYLLADRACAARGLERPYLPTEVARAYLRLDQGREEEVCSEVFEILDSLPPPGPEGPASHAELQGLWGACLVVRGDVEKGRRALRGARTTLRHHRGAAYPIVRWIGRRLAASGSVPSTDRRRSETYSAGSAEGSRGLTEPVT